MYTVHRGSPWLVVMKWKGMQSQKWREFPWGRILEYRLGGSLCFALKVSLSQVAAAIWWQPYLYLSNSLICICQVLVSVFVKYLYLYLSNTWVPAQRIPASPSKWASVRWQQPSGDKSICICQIVVSVFVKNLYLYLSSTCICICQILKEEAALPSLLWASVRWQQPSGDNKHQYSCICVCICICQILLSAPKESDARKRALSHQI